MTDKFGVVKFVSRSRLALKEDAFQIHPDVFFGNEKAYYFGSEKIQNKSS